MLALKNPHIWIYKLYITGDSSQSNTAPLSQMQNAILLISRVPV